MKTKVILDTNWRLAQLPAPSDSLDGWEEDKAEWLPVHEMPAEVHDIFLQNKLLSEDMLVGWCDEGNWITACDWVYRCEFESRQHEGKVYLHCKGLDTIVDVYLNGKRIAEHDDFYLPCRVEITDIIQEKNILLFHFHNIFDAMDKGYYDPEWEGMVDKWKVLRKPYHDQPYQLEDGSDYQGAHRYHTPVGIYDEIYIEYADAAQITEDHIQAKVSEDYKKGEVMLALSGIRDGLTACGITAYLFDPEDRLIDTQILDVYCGGEEWTAKGLLKTDKPRLWYPRGFGEQPLYKVKIELHKKESISSVYDSLEKKIGFRRVQMAGTFDYKINGKIVRLWGGSMDPFQGITHCWRRDRALRLLDMVENANMNTLRCWGEGGIPYSEEFYDEADRRGILIWQEFFIGYGAYPENHEYREKCVAEAEFLVKRLRHRACLLLWCGGNETRMGAEYTDRNRPFYGEPIICEDFPDVVQRLDPDKYYHESSPSGGAWSNDPRYGDHHTYDCIWQYPGGEYPNMVSEHIRTAPPVMHSLRKFVKQGEEFWPKDYTGLYTYQSRAPLPDSWMERVCTAAMMDLKTGPVGDFYDADTPEETVYRFGAAYGLEMRRGLEKVRMGSKEGGLYRKQRSRGHFSCKLNDTWPKIYCAVIDYFGEGYIPYYATKRAQEPVLLCFDIRPERINLWLVNDSGEDIRGTVTFALFNPLENKYTDMKKIPASMPQGQSDIVMNLDFLLFFRKYHLLFAKFESEVSEFECSTIDFVDIERHMRFPEAKLDVKLEGNTLIITTDSFARCIELTGDDKGDAFGWMFEDNYFDLLPGQTKKVKILGKHTDGMITVKPHFSPNKVNVAYHVEK